MDRRTSLEQQDKEPNNVIVNAALQMRGKLRSPAPQDNRSTRREREFHDMPGNFA